MNSFVRNLRSIGSVPSVEKLPFFDKVFAKLVQSSFVYVNVPVWTILVATGSEKTLEEFNNEAYAIYERQQLAEKKKKQTTLKKK